jgi:hypothetical protein
VSQWGRWQDFRRLQRYARGQHGYDCWRSIWEEEEKYRAERDAIMTTKWRQWEQALRERDKRYDKKRWEREWQHNVKYGFDKEIVYISGVYVMVILHRVRRIRAARLS